MAISSRMPVVRQASSTTFSPAAPKRSRDRHFLVFGQRLNRYARTRDRDVQHLPASRGDDADVGAITPDLIEFDPQSLARGLVDLVPAVEQQQHAGRVSGCRASSSGERIGESTITAPPSMSPYWDATFIVINPPKLWPMTKGRSPS
jgi:hypothetical protein